MNVNQNLKIIIILIILYSLPSLFSYFFNNAFQLWNTQVNDLFFKLRFSVKGSEKISPLFYLFTITDSFDTAYADNQIDRTIYATVLEKLYSAKVKTVLCDIIFSDARAGDLKLVDATLKNGNICYPFYLSRQTEGEKSGVISPLVKKILFIPASQKYEGSPQFVRLDTIRYPFKALALAAAGLGFSNTDSDKDGIKRTIPLFYQSDQGYLPSLVLTGICKYLQVDTSRIEIQYGKYLKLPDAQFYGIKKELTIPIDKKGQMIINFPGPIRKSLTSYPLERVIEAIAGDESDLYGLLQNSFVFIGDISTRGKDFGRGIFDFVYPNSFVLGSALNTILTENYLTTSYPAKNCLLFLMILFLLLLCWLISINRSFRFFISALLLSFLLIVLLIFGVNLCFFILMNNLSQTVELLLGTMSAVFALFIYKSFTFSPDPLRKYEDEESIVPVPAKIPYEDTDLETILRASGIVTKIQLDTALFCLEGLTSKEIAVKLNVTEHAVKRRLHKIFQICKVKSRLEFAKKVYGIK